MNVETPVSDRPLPCGHSTGELLDYHLDGEDSALEQHLATCPHCQAELAEIAERWGAVRRAAETPVRAPEGLLERTLAVLRESRDHDTGEWVELQQERGRLYIRPTATVSLTRGLVRRILRETPELTLLSCVPEGRVLRVDLVATYPAAAWRLLPGLRQRIEAELVEHLGVSAPEITVRLADVAPPTRNEHER
ncbi:anti-sigma factor family protein [Actinopolyspora mortivallis]|uniref:anti-sigma factor family protein n=1 Tax=Actinopolyspora mortivallis TaxID=33906 RepID=UPI000380A83C|nr:hypothetical protein [Actinopolyspora mortivallis]